MQKVLLIDDDAQLGKPLAAYLLRFEIALEQSLKPSQGFEQLQTNQYDAIILDVMMPEMDGFDCCKRIRQTSSIPILMLTARGELTDRVVGLELGADDYLPKPFEPRELVARLQAIMRRNVIYNAVNKDTASTLEFEQLSIDPIQRTVRVNNMLVDLTSGEFDLLLLLAKAPGKVFSRDDLLNHIKGREVDIQTRAIDIMVSRIRKKLEPIEPLKTLRNAGYVFSLARVHP
jgi:two-component system, OmpR family, response regulator